MSWLKTENLISLVVPDYYPPHNLIYSRNISPTSQWNAYSCSPEIWELSRFSAVDFSNPPSSTSQAVSSPVSIAILQEAINFAREQGAKQLITTSPLGVERLLRAAGFVPIVQVHQ